jgi:hypothetical protein
VQNVLKHISVVVDKNNEKQWLLIADNNAIKKLIIERFPQIQTIIQDITHFAQDPLHFAQDPLHFAQDPLLSEEGVVLDKANEKVKNSMLDFYLLSLSCEIAAFSVYKHGSGFSSWCAKTYDIPYSCKLVQ